MENADYIFFECGLYKKVLQKSIPATVNTGILYLCKEQSENAEKLIEQILQRPITDKKKISFSYLGSISHIIDMEGICRVLENIHAHGIITEIHIIGIGGNEKEFIEKLEKTQTKVYMHGAVYDEIEKIKLLANTDFGFNMMKNTVKVGLTTKSVDYFSMGIPIINNIKEDTWSLVEKYQAGFNVDNSNLEILSELIMRADISEMKWNAKRVYEENFTEKHFLKTVSQALKFSEII